MLTQRDLIARWDSIPRYSRVFQLVDATHPAEWYIGYSDLGNHTLLAISTSPFKKLQSTQSIEVVQRKRIQDNRWTLSFELVVSEQIDVFSLFCSDIIEYSRSVQSEGDAAQRIESRWTQWSRLLEKQKKPLLSESECIGLMGELYLLTSLVKSGMTPEVAVSGWVGPEGADRDFEYHDTWYEVKTTGVASQKVTISSLEQLDCEMNGYLVIVRLDKCSPENNNAVTLDSLIEAAKMTLSGSASALESFNQKLNQAGYLPKLEYSEQKYHLSGKAYYRVTDSFPKIIRMNVPHEITKATYDLSIAAIERWKE